jgi:hypothetical protein
MVVVNLIYKKERYNIMLFKAYLTENSAVLKTYMKWENYDLNTSVLPVVEMVQDDALEVLSNNYGKFEVDDILDELKTDIFLNFPALLQQLSISRIMTSAGTKQSDSLTDIMTRTENGVRDTSQSSDNTLGTNVTELNTLNTLNTSNGTSIDTGTSTTNVTSDTTQNNLTNIINTSGVQMTGSKNVNLTNAMPEQSINAGTGNFPLDAEGTPILTTAYVQSANQNFTTTNPIDTSETSEQSTDITVGVVNTNLITNNLTNTQHSTVADTGTTNRTIANSGTDLTTNTAIENTDNTVTETTTRQMTNPNYAYEIKAFLESVDSLNAFQKWLDKFSWICGIS